MEECIICVTMMDNCVICNTCNTRVCLNCMDEYVNHCARDNKIANCPNCSDDYGIETMNREYLDRYAKHVTEYLKRNHDFLTKLEDKGSITKIIRTLRKNKRDRIDELPGAIREMITLCFSNEFEKIMRDNKEHIEYNRAKLREDNRRKCFNVACFDGKLDDHGLELICDSCFSTYCSKCEKIMYDVHRCDQNDVESVKYANDNLKCPTCKANCEKITECNNLTCSICKTNFNNITGEITDGAGHYTGYKQNTTYRFHLELEDKYKEKLMSKIRNYEESIPEKPDETQLLECFNEDRTLKEGVSNLEVYQYYSDIFSVINIRKKMYSVINKLRRLHVEEKLTYESAIALLPKT